MQVGHIGRRADSMKDAKRKADQMGTAVANCKYWVPMFGETLPYWLRRSTRCDDFGQHWAGLVVEKEYRLTFSASNTPVKSNPDGSRVRRKKPPKKSGGSL